MCFLLHMALLKGLIPAFIPALTPPALPSSQLSPLTMIDLTDTLLGPPPAGTTSGTAATPIVVSSISANSAVGAADQGQGRGEEEVAAVRREMELLEGQLDEVSAECERLQVWTEAACVSLIGVRAPQSAP